MEKERRVGGSDKKDPLYKCLDDLKTFKRGRMVEAYTVADTVERMLSDLTTGQILNLRHHGDRLEFLAHYANPKSVLSIVDGRMVELGNDTGEDAGKLKGQYSLWRKAFIEKVGEKLKDT